MLTTINQRFLISTEKSEQIVNGTDSAYSKDNVSIFKVFHQSHLSFCFPMNTSSYLPCKQRKEPRQSVTLWISKSIQSSPSAEQVNLGGFQLAV
jgi:hypothetical protein